MPALERIKHLLYIITQKSIPQNARKIKYDSALLPVFPHNNVPLFIRRKLLLILQLSKAKITYSQILVFKQEDILLSRIMESTYT